MQILIVLSVFSLSLNARGDYQCHRSDFDFKNFSNRVFKSSCELLKDSQQCQGHYEEIKKSGKLAKDYELKCDLNTGKTSTDLDQFYLGCYVGAFDAMVGDTYQFLSEIAEKAISDFEIDSYCNANPKYKTMLYVAHNSIHPPEMQIPVPTETKLKSYSCATIRQAISEEHRYLNVKKRRKASISPRDDAHGILVMAKALLKNLGIKLECYNSRKQAELLCRAAT